MNFYNQRVKILDVVGEVEAQGLVEFNTVLKDADPLVENPIVEEKFEIQDMQKHVFHGKVVLQGKLIKNIIYKAVKGNRSSMAHETVKEPFIIEIPIPGLRRGTFLGRRKLLINEVDDTHLQVHILGINSDTNLSWTNKEEDECDKDGKKGHFKDAEIIFHNPYLAKRYHGKFKWKIEGNNSDHNRRNYHKFLFVNEKVIIRVFVVAGKFKVQDIPVARIPQVFHCTSELTCGDC